MRAIIAGAVVRAYRVFVYVFVGAAGVANIPVIHSLADLKEASSSWAFAFVTAIASSIIAFLVGTAEGLADRPLIGPAPHVLTNGAKDGTSE